MERLGHLCRLNTAYPRWKVTGIPSEKVRSFPWLMTLMMAAGRFGVPIPQSVYRITAESFDNWAARNLEPCDVFHCLSAFAVRSGAFAQQRFGALWVCDRGSSHIQYQDEVLATEFDRWGIKYVPIDPRMVERELAEYEMCDLITLPSGFAYRSFLDKKVPEEKLALLPFGVDLELFKPVAKNDHTFRVIYVGQMSLRKGLGDLLQAALSPRLPNAELWLIGPTLPEARSLLAKYEGQYRYFGPVPRSRLPELYSQGSVFVLASVEEGLAMVQAQAMACGLPVIATTNTGAEDLFTDRVEGFIVPIRNPDAIRERIVQLYQNPDLRKQMSARALERVRSIRGWDCYGEKVATRYHEALSERNTKASLRALGTDT
jgi:glycosyltransferase involved in cell wall biosynthesis